MRWAPEAKRDFRSTPVGRFFALLTTFIFALGCASVSAGSAPHLQSAVGQTLPSADPALGTVRVATEPLIATLSVRLVASPSQIELGQKTNLTALTSGGVAPYNYSWGGLPPGCPNTNTSSMNCTPQATGRFQLSVTVMDAASHTAVNSTTLNVTGPSNPSFLGGALLPYVIAGIIGALAAPLTLFGLYLSKRRRQKRARITPYTDSQYVPPPPEPPL
jgi:hypothetical protein